VAEGLVTFIEADTGDRKSLEAALAGVSHVVVCTGTTAFPTKAWLGGNTPKKVDDAGVRNIVDAWCASTPRVKRRRLALMSSIGVTRRDSFPFSVLNAAGVLDAKAAGEGYVKARAAKPDDGFEFAVVRPGQLFGGPYENNVCVKRTLAAAATTPPRQLLLLYSHHHCAAVGSPLLPRRPLHPASLRCMSIPPDSSTSSLTPRPLRYLGTLFELEKDAAVAEARVTEGDTEAGDTTRATLAEAMVASLLSDAPAADFTVLNQRGPATTADAMVEMIDGLGEEDGAPVEKPSGPLGEIKARLENMRRQ
jgi:hypothetical protein